ncbi:MAG: hypothetical protein ABIQ07_11055 [Ginsengibacter sp.]
MKKCLIILNLLIALSSTGQATFSHEDSILFKFAPGIDISKHHDYVLHVQRLIKFKNADSILESLKIINELCNFLPKKYNAHFFFNELNEIDSFKANYMQLILGNWKSEILGSNWAFLNKNLINPNRRVMFNDREVLFYLHDTLIRATTYKIVWDTTMMAFDNFLIEFGDSREKWACYFIEVGQPVPFHENAKKMHLLLNKEPNCSCGCPLELYSKDQNNPITFSNYKSTNF